MQSLKDEAALQVELNAQRNVPSLALLASEAAKGQIDESQQWAKDAMDNVEREWNEPFEVSANQILDVVPPPDNQMLTNAVAALSQDIAGYGADKLREHAAWNLAFAIRKDRDFEKNRVYYRSLLHNLTAQNRALRERAYFHRKIISTDYDAYEYAELVIEIMGIKWRR